MEYSRQEQHKFSLNAYTKTILFYDTKKTWLSYQSFWHLGVATTRLSDDFESRDKLTRLGSNADLCGNPTKTNIMSSTGRFLTHLKLNIGVEIVKCGINITRILSFTVIVTFIVKTERGQP